MIKKIKVKKPLSEFLGRKKIGSINELLSAMEGAAYKVGANKTSIVFPSICELDARYGFSYSADIDLKKNIDMERLLRSVVSQVLNVYDDQPALCAESVFVSYRFEKYAVQIMNGHLKIGDNDQIMPMHPVFSHTDGTFVKSLKTYKAAELDKKDMESISNLLDPFYLENKKISEGLASQLISWASREKTTGQIGEILGFNVIAKESEGWFNSKKKEKCPIVRTCVHNKEISGGKLADEVIDTYNRMKTLRNDPSCIIGIQSIIEIHIDSKRITITCGSFDKDKVFESFLSKILELIGVKDLDSATIEYEKEVYTEDPLWITAGKAFVGTVSNIADFFSQDAVKAAVCLMLILVGLPFFAWAVLVNNHSVLKTAILILPSVLLYAVLGCRSFGKSWLLRVGDPSNFVVTYIFLFFSGAIYLLFSFKAYLFVLASLAVIIASAILEDRISERYEKLSKKYEKLSKWVSACYQEIFSSRIFSNSVVNVALATGTIAMGIMGFIMFGFLILLAAIPTLILVFIAVMFDKEFWSDTYYDKERIKDHFFSNYIEARPELTEDCEIRMKKCWKLSIWIPIKVFFMELVVYGRDKFSRWLKIPSVTGKVSGMIRKQYAKILPGK